MVKVLLIDDHNIVIEGILGFFENSEEISILDTATDGDIGYKKLFNTKYDVLVTDLNMPKVSGIELIKKVKHNFSEIKIITLTTYYQPALLKQLKELQVEGIVIKTLGMQELRKAILEVNSGNIYYSETPSKTNLEEENNWDDFSQLFSLSKREIEILLLVCDGCSSSEIAEKLFISDQTVGSHRKSIFKKTNTHSAIELYKLALKHNLIHD